MAEVKSLPIKFRIEAELLAEQPFSIIVIREIDCNDQPIFVAINSDLEGCVAHGKSSEEAIENLKEATKDYLQVLLLTNAIIPVPEACDEENTIPSGMVYVPIYYRAPDKLNSETLSNDIGRMNNRKIITEFAFKTLCSVD